MTMPESSVKHGSSSGPSNSPVQAVHEDTRPQAGPLPSKRGEIGFVDGVHTPITRQFQESSESVVMPARHPADRDLNPSNTPTFSPETEAGHSTPATSSNLNSSSGSVTKSKRLFGFFRPKNNTVYGGVRLITLFLFVVQLSVFTATIVGWVFIAKLLHATSPSGQRLPTSASSAVLIHIIFGIAALTQLVFLERRLYRLRGERYTYQHPGEVLPRFRANSPGVDSATIAFAPWNRPPLPTYAAALAQSGVGTGDVEDNLIAAPPPPAYGNTRGSTLLLAGYLSASLRAERPPSEHSQPGSRPMSYVTREEPWQSGQEVDRSVRLEATLNRLESNPSSAAVP